MKILLVLLGSAMWAQEASSGLDLHGTLSGQAAYSPEFERQPRDGGSFAAGVRGVLYPTLKISSNWSVAGAFQAYSQPFFSEEFSRRGYNAETNLLQLHLTYSRFFKRGSVVARVGQLTPAFGSFQLRYDDAVNPLIGAPLSYGYYGTGITLRGLPGAEIGATLGRFDGRVQFTNSSPANPRTLREKDQYGAWSGGVGYSIAQGFRIGLQAYRGPYVSRDYAFYFPGEARPRDLPGKGLGFEAQWARGPWNALGEIQHFRMEYRLIPTFVSDTGYAELRRVLHPRWYLATRLSYMRHNYAKFETYELVAGFRPNRFQILKFGYALGNGIGNAAVRPGRFQVQLVSQFRGLSLSKD